MAKNKSLRNLSTSHDEVDDQESTEKTADELREENDRLKALVEKMQTEGVPVRPNTRPKPHEPSYGISEGQRDELERQGWTISPFTGKKLVATGTDERGKVQYKEAPRKDESIKTSDVYAKPTSNVA